MNKLPVIISEIERDSKSAKIKRDIITYFMNTGYATIAALAKSMDLSVPTISKFVDELTDAHILCECGKLETNGGRHPTLYDLNSESCYFGGVDIKSDTVSLGLIDFCGNMVDKVVDVPYIFENTPESLDRLCEIITEFIKATNIEVASIVDINVNISGRVNPKTGNSYCRYNFGKEPLADVLSRRLGYNVIIENDTRAMALGEYKQGQNADVDNMIFVNVGWGLGIGIVIDRKLYSGKSGFAGEFGHMVTCDNEIICHCGKKGCLETEASGVAMHRKFIEAMKMGENSILAKKYRDTGDVTLNDLIEAVTKYEDVLCIGLVEQIGNTLGRWIAGLINIFNPERVVIGGSLSATGDYLLQPIRTHVRRYSLNLVNQDTEIVLSHLVDDAGLIGACETARRAAFRIDQNL